MGQNEAVYGQSMKSKTRETLHGLLLGILFLVGCGRFETTIEQFLTTPGPKALLLWEPGAGGAEADDQAGFESSLRQYGVPVRRIYPPFSLPSALDSSVILVVPDRKSVV